MPIKQDNFKHIERIEDAEEGKINVIMARNGMFQVIKNRLMYIIKKININPFAKVEELEEKIIIQEPLNIPSKLVLTALVFLKKVKHKYDTEAVVIITEKDGKYLLELPEQEASAAAVTYSTKNLTGTPILIIHSHPGNLHDTRFSHIDDRDDKFAIFNGVTSVYMNLRIKIGDNFVEPDDADLFDIDRGWVNEKLNEFSKYVKRIHGFKIDDYIDFRKWR
jgi:hypothetical protein